MGLSLQKKKLILRLWKKTEIPSVKMWLEEMKLLHLERICLFCQTNWTTLIRIGFPFSITWIAQFE